MGLLDTISNFSHVFSLPNNNTYFFFCIFVPFCADLGDLSVTVHSTPSNRDGYVTHTCPNHSTKLVTCIWDFMCSHWERQLRTFLQDDVNLELSVDL